MMVVKILALLCATGIRDFSLFSKYTSLKYLCNLLYLCLTNFNQGKNMKTPCMYMQNLVGHGSYCMQFHSITMGRDDCCKIPLLFLSRYLFFSRLMPTYITSE